MQEQEIRRKWSHAITLWWAMMWRITLWLFVLMAAVITLTQWLFPYDSALQQLINDSVLLISLPPLGVYAIHAVLNRNFGRFRLALVPPVAGEKRRGLFTPVLWLRDRLLCKGDAAAQQEKSHKDESK